MVFPVSVAAVFRGQKFRALALVLASGLTLAACASTTPQMAAMGVRTHTAAVAPATQVQPQAQPSRAPARVASNDRFKAPAPGAEAAAGGKYKLGAPYEAGGLWYVPAEEPEYDEVGVASWYGDDFDGKATANGERFDMYTASAAHATLPMPSIVEVTNLENGRTIRVRLNDRGPFKNGRIIDLSQAGARELGYFEKGTAQVRVRYVGPARLDGSLEPLYVSNKTDKGLKSPFPAGAPTPAEAPAFARPPVIAAAPPVGQGAYAVQAGAFSDRARAESVARALSTAGQAAIRPIEVASRQLYRVVVGPWRDEGQAQAARAQVASLGFSEARVVKF